MSDGCTCEGCDFHEWLPNGGGVVSGVYLDHTCWALPGSFSVRARLWSATSRKPERYPRACAQKRVTKEASDD